MSHPLRHVTPDWVMSHVHESCDVLHLLQQSATIWVMSLIHELCHTHWDTSHPIESCHMYMSHITYYTRCNNQVCGSLYVSVFVCLFFKCTLNVCIWNLVRIHLKISRFSWFSCIFRTFCLFCRSFLPSFGERDTLKKRKICEECVHEISSEQIFCKCSEFCCAQSVLYSARNEFCVLLILWRTLFYCQNAFHANVTEHTVRNRTHVKEYRTNL